MLIPKLRYWRERRALTQEELAEKANVGTRSVAGYEAGAGARPGNVRKLAEALDIDVSALMEPEAPKDPPPHSLSELLGRAGATDGHLAMSTPELMEAFEGLSYQEALQLARKIAEARGAIRPILEQYEATPEGKMLAALAAERSIVAKLCLQVIAERERGQAAAQGDLDRVHRIEKDLKEVA